MKHKNIGFVSYWFNRGQAVVTRYIKSIFDEAGYNTFVLVRSPPSKVSGEGKGDWAKGNITMGSGTYDMPIRTYTDWAKKNKLDICFFDQNYQFNAIRAIRSLGIKTVGRYVWEQYGAEHVAGSVKSLDVLYSLTKAERKRYSNKFGIDSPLLRWGIHPTLVNLAKDRKKRNDDLVTFYFPAGYCNQRKSIKRTLKAFSSVKNKNARLLITSQKPIKDINDNRVSIITKNIELQKDFLKIMAGCDVCLIPSKWEGLGLSFMEAIAFSMPIITTDFAPMNEYVEHGKTGLLIRATTDKRLPNNLQIAEVSVQNFKNQMEWLSDRKRVTEMSNRISEVMPKRYDWENTRGDYLKLVRGL